MRLPGSVSGTPDGAGEALARAVASATLADHEANALAAGNLVAGAAAEGHGVLISWSGRGELTRAALVAICADAGAVDWAPAPRTTHAHAAAAVATCAHGLVARATKAPRVTRVDERGTARSVTQTPTERGWSARWTLGAVAGHGEVGEAYGQISAVVSLSPDGQALDVEGDAHLAERIRAEYARLVDGDTYHAADITHWLRGCLYAAGSVKLGGGYYVPRAVRERAEAVTAALAAAWGTDWLVPALPVATSAQLQAGLTRGLAAEVADVVADVAADTGGRAAATLLRRLVEIRERAAGLAALVGDAGVAAIRAQLTAAVAAVEPLLSDGAQRAALLDLY